MSLFISALSGNLQPPDAHLFSSRIVRMDGDNFVPHQLPTVARLEKERKRKKDSMQDRVLAFLREFPGSTVESIATSFGCHTNSVQCTIHRLRELKKIERALGEHPATGGRGKYSYWVNDAAR